VLGRVRLVFVVGGQVLGRARAIVVRLTGRGQSFVFPSSRTTIGAREYKARAHRPIVVLFEQGHARVVW